MCVVLPLGQDQSSMGLVGVLFGKYIGLFSFGTRLEVEDTRKRTFFEGGHCNGLIRTKVQVIGECPCLSSTHNPSTPTTWKTEHEQGKFPCECEVARHVPEGWIAFWSMMDIVKCQCATGLQLNGASHQLASFWEVVSISTNSLCAPGDAVSPLPAGVNVRCRKRP